ncbi:divalent-cation tolerance protein CutA [Novosphingobium flavum]|uniref:Divalent-cation tolerance protein CutA n=1 Tax=Novosphingobium flavum TaxID=1778672 RepID=A0A7X1KKH7_9SPHN|nr:divalent-cation tolerance protein CutA [Novosphingobium flavum]
MAVPSLVWCPFPDEAEAGRVADILLDEGLIACANILPGMRSLYVWNGEKGENREAGVLFKTNSSLIERLVVRLVELHAYDEPAILGWRCDHAAPGTATWLGGLGS